MVYQLKVKLLNVSKPSVWRKIIVPGEFTFAQLHNAIQAAMGWGNYHLYQFSYKGYGDPLCITTPEEQSWLSRQLDAGKTPINKFLNAEHPKMKYIYDFGDDWIHDVVLEKAILEEEVQQPLPYCLAAKGACPPEDCGGPYMYEHLKDTTDYLDPTFVDIDFINCRLASDFKAPDPKKAAAKAAKIAQRKEKIIELTNPYCDESMEVVASEAKEEVKNIIDILIENHQDITLGKVEIWAAAIAYVVNEYHFIDANIDQTCEYFGLKSAGARNRVTTIHNVLYDVGYYDEDEPDEEFDNLLSSLGSTPYESLPPHIREILDALYPNR